MTITSFRRAAVPGIAALALALSACGASNESSADSGSDSAGSLSGDLKGAGATSQEKAQEAWSTGIQGMNPDLTIEYNLVGSTDGRVQFVEEAVSFAGTDSALTDDEGELTAATERCGGEEPIQVPAYVSPIAVAFNLEGVDALNLTPETIAQIFDNKITSWDDPAIAEENPDVDLPAEDISPVHRSDDSGTTKNFTDYLGQASDSWPYEAEDAFPVDGEAAEGTSGVIANIEQNNGTIGYADNSQVGDLSVASVQVGEDFVAPSPEGAAKVVEVSPAVEGASEVDMAVELDRTTTEPDAYPVVLLSYLIACQSYDDAEEEANVKGYLAYIVSDDGQAEAADYAGSAPLAASTAEKAQAVVDGIGG